MPLGYFGVTMVHQTLTWTSESLMCICNLFASVNTQGARGVGVGGGGGGSVYSLTLRTFVVYVQNLNLEKFQGGHIMVTHPFGDHATGSIQQKMLCIYNPQITISPVSSFSVSFNGNCVKNCSKPWTCPLTWAFESKCSCSSCSAPQTFLNQCLELSVWVLEFRISLSLHMNTASKVQGN